MEATRKDLIDFIGLFGHCTVFVYFCIEFNVGKLSKSLLFVKVGAPNDYGTAFVGWFDDIIPNFNILVGSPFF